MAPHIRRKKGRGRGRPFQLGNDAGKEHRFGQPGANPSGPGGSKSVEVLMDEFRVWVPDMAEVLLGIAKNPEARESARVAAAREVLDRAMGNPAQSVSVKSENEGRAEKDQARDAMATAIKILGKDEAANILKNA